MDASRVKKFIYTSSQILDWFGIDNNTLLQWEQNGEIEKPEYLPSGERLYKKHQVEKIAKIVRLEIRKELDKLAAGDSKEILPPASLQEALYKVEFFSGEEIDHALQQIEGLAIQNGLSEGMCNTLVHEALMRPKADPVRHHIWKIMLKDSESGNG